MGGLLFFPGGALLVIVEIRGGAQQPVPVLVGLCGALFELSQLFSRYGRRLDGGQRFRPFGRSPSGPGFAFSASMFFMESTSLTYHVGKNSKPSPRARQGKARPPTKRASDCRCNGAAVPVRIENKPMARHFAQPEKRLGSLVLAGHADKLFNNADELSEA